MNKIIVDLKNLKTEELKEKFFQNLKEEKNKEKKDISNLLIKVYGKDFLCKYDYCNEYIKLLTFEFLLNPKEIFNKYKEGIFF